MAGGAPISTRATVAVHQTGMLRLAGTDRFGHIADLSKYGEGAVVFDVPVIPAGVPRLRNLAASYQRIVWRKLVFRFEPMVPSVTTGGYVCGFVPDPDDDLAQGNAIDRLLAHTGSKMVKAWQATVVAHKCVGDRLFTSRPVNGESRLYSPGRVALVVDTKISAGRDTPAGLSIYLDWEVELMEPSLEGPSTKATTLEARASFYSRASNVGLWWKDTAGGDDPRTQIPGIQFDQLYALKSKRFVSFGQGETAVLGNFDRVVLQNHPTHGVTLFVVGYDDRILELTSSQNVWFLEAGDTLTPVPKNSLTGLEHLPTPKLWENFGPRPRRLCEQSEDSDPWVLA